MRKTALIEALAAGFSTAKLAMNSGSTLAGAIR